MKKVLHTYRRGPCGWSTANWGHKLLATFVATYEPLIEIVEARHQEFQVAGENAELLEEVVPTDHPVIQALQKIAEKDFGVSANIHGCTRLAVYELYTPAVIRCQSGKEEMDEILEGDLLINPSKGVSE